MGAFTIAQRQPAARLIELGLALVHHFLRGLGRGPRGIDRGGQRLGRRDHAVVLGARNLVLIHQRLVPPNVALRLRVIRFDLLQSGHGRGLIPLGRRDTRFGVRDFGLARRNICLRSALRDRKIRIFRSHLGLCFQQLRLSLFQRDLIIARIEFHEQLSRLHGLIFFHVNRFHFAIDPRRNAVEVAVHLGVIGGFVGPGIQPERDRSDQEHGADNGRENQRPAPPLGVAA